MTNLISGHFPDHLNYEFLYSYIFMHHSSLLSNALWCALVSWAYKNLSFYPYCLCLEAFNYTYGLDILKWLEPIILSPIIIFNKANLSLLLVIIHTFFYWAWIFTTIQNGYCYQCTSSSDEFRHSCTSSGEMEICFLLYNHRQDHTNVYMLDWN